MNKVIIIHNPQCSKSRAALELLESRGMKPLIINYLQGELTRELLTTTLQVLKLRAKEVLRIQDLDSLNIVLNQDNDLEVIEAILKYPKILERPIIIKGDDAVIGRPVENIFKLKGFV